MHCPEVEEKPFMTSFATINNLTLHFRLEGSKTGAPLVFVNSLGTDLRIWDGVVARLGDSYRIIRYDKRGHGLSEQLPGPYTLQDERADLAGLLSYLDVRSPVVIGISVGGMIGLDYAAHHQVQGLVVCDSALRFATADFWQARIAAIAERGMAAMAPTLALRWFAPDYMHKQPHAYRGYVTMLARMPAEGYCATCELLAHADVGDAARVVQVPSLVLGGAQDQSTPPHVVRQVAEALPDSRFKVIEGAGHLPCIEQPAETARLIAMFLREIDYV